MKDIFSKVIATVIAAGIIGNVVVWRQFGERLARIETKLEIMQAGKLAANKI